MKTYVVGAHKKPLTEGLLMNTHNICFRGEIRKILVLLDWKNILSRAMNILSEYQYPNYSKYLASHAWANNIRSRWNSKSLTRVSTACHPASTFWMHKQESSGLSNFYDEHGKWLLCPNIYSNYGKMYLDTEHMHNMQNGPLHHMLSSVCTSIHSDQGLLLCCCILEYPLFF